MLISRVLKRRWILRLIGLSIAIGVVPDLVIAKTLRVYIGTYTHDPGVSNGIYTCEFNTETGRLTKPTLAAKTENPSFLAIHPNRKWLYAVNELMEYNGDAQGAVSAWMIDGESGKLTLINQQPTGGGAPCHCIVDGTGRFLLLANYLGGNAAVLPIGPDGSLQERSCLIQHEGTGPDKARQKGPHAHSINLSSDNRFAYVADLGIDQIRIYTFDDRRGMLTPNRPGSVSVKPGGGPRHFCLHPTGRFAYSEMTCEVTAFSRDPQTGTLNRLHELSTIPDDYDGALSTAECLMHPNGRTVYVSNRGHDSVACFSVDQDTGRLTLIEIESTGGRTPRNIFVTPDGKWLLAENSQSNRVVVFTISNDGSLTATGETIDVGSPICIRMLPIAG